MHAPSQSDPAPDSPVFRDHVMCEHGGLALNISSRTRISRKVCQRSFAPDDMFIIPRLSHCSRHFSPHGSPCLMLLARALCVTPSRKIPARIKESYAKRRKKRRWDFSVICGHQRYLLISWTGETQTYARECSEWKHSTS